jgi:hypothetical protein
MGAFFVIYPENWKLSLLYSFGDDIILVYFELTFRKAFLDTNEVTLVLAQIHRDLIRSLLYCAIQLVYGEHAELKHLFRRPPEENEAVFIQHYIAVILVDLFFW